MSPGKTLRDARVLMRLTQAELAEQVGTSPQNIGKLERDEIKQPNRELMQRIGQVLDVSIERLLFGGHAPPKLSESSIIMARQIEKLPPEPKLEIVSILLRYQDECETAAKQTSGADPVSGRNPA